MPEIASCARKPHATRSAASKHSPGKAGSRYQSPHHATSAADEAADEAASIPSARQAMLAPQLPLCDYPAVHLVNLDTFVRVAELGSMAAAARALGVPKSTVGRRVESLEAELGVSLLQRSSRQATLTDDGRALRERCAGPLRELDEVKQLLDDRGSQPRGKLVVSMASDSGQSVAVDLAAGFARLNPNVQLEVRTPHIRMGWLPLLEEGVDVVLDMVSESGPAAQGADSEYLIQRKLRTLRAYLFASPGYLKEMGTPKSLDELASHRLMSLAQEPFDHSWRLCEDRGPAQKLAIKPQFVSSYVPVLMGYLLSGAALGLCPTHTSTSHERRGSLVRVLPSWSTEPLQLRLVWLRTRHLAPRIRAFVDYVQAELPNAPWIE